MLTGFQRFDDAMHHVLVMVAVAVDHDVGLLIERVALIHQAGEDLALVTAGQQRARITARDTIQQHVQIGA